MGPTNFKNPASSANELRSPFIGRYGVPASAGERFACSECVEFLPMIVFERAAPAKAGTPYQGYCPTVRRIKAITIRDRLLLQPLHIEDMDFFDEML
jgi:hypothetical protein